MEKIITDHQGRTWHAVLVPTLVAHAKEGATLGFRLADQPDADPLPASISWNSMRSAEATLATLGTRELRRRLAQAQITGGRVIPAPMP